MGAEDLINFGTASHQRKMSGTTSTASQGFFKSCVASTASFVDGKQISKSRKHSRNKSIKIT